MPQRTFFIFFAALSLFIFPLSVLEAEPLTLRAGSSEIEITPKKGVPLGGYGGGNRRLARPDLDPFNDHTFLSPSTGVLDPLFAKAVVIESEQKKLCILTIDAIAIEGELVTLAVKRARSLGFTVPLESVLACASHTHSGSGAVTRSFLWQVSAMDRLRRKVRQRLIDRLARVLTDAEKALAPAKIGLGTFDLTGATKNRRAKLDKSILRTDIDPQLAVIRIDNLKGSPIATVWNFAIHGTMHGPRNSKFSADVMGLVNTALSKKKLGTVLFINGAEGDIAPSGGPKAAELITQAVVKLHSQIKTAQATRVLSRSTTLDLGRPKMTVTEGVVGELEEDIMGLKNFLKGRKNGIAVPLSRRFIENKVRLQAIKIGSSVIVSVPGEAIASLGQEIRTEVKKLGFDKVLIAGLANNHIGYILTEREFNRGGYEAFVSFYGPKAGATLCRGCYKTAEKLKD
jgi:neutral ceramidase